jgi:hypothetical protein
MRDRVLGAAVALVCAAAMVAAQGSGLRIVVLSGEDGVNIIGKGTAVAPVVEVRDRNDQPVAGASVLFLLGGNNARFAGNAARLAVTTDQSGRATAAGLQAVGKGAVRIQVQASFQGETATATVTQANFANAAEAAQVGKSVTNAQPGANSGSQTPSQAAAQGSHPIGLIAAGAGAVAGGIVAKNALSGDTSCDFTPLDAATTAFDSLLGQYADCVSRGSAASCASLQNAVTAATERFVDANAAYCVCIGHSPGSTAADVDAYAQGVLAGRGGSRQIPDCR